MDARTSSPDPPKRQARLRLRLALAILACPALLYGHDGLPGGTVHIDGAPIYYEIDGEGPPILLMHGGLGLDHWSFHWPGAIPPLADSYRLIYYDHRANGRSGGSAASLSFDRLTADAEGLRTSLGLGQVVVVGFSFGGFIALEYALHYPESVRALILYSTTPYSVGPAGDPPPGAEHRTGEWANYFLSDEIRRAFNSRDRTLVRHDAAIGGTRIEQGFDLKAHLYRIEAPSLILAGRHDWYFTVEQHRELAGALPDGRLEVFEESGHFIHVEQPLAFQQAIRAFLTEVYGD